MSEPGAQTEEDVMDSIPNAEGIGNSEIGELRRRVDDLSRRLEDQKQILKDLPEITAEAVRRTPVDSVLDVRGVAAHLAVSERTVETLVAEGQITPIWVGGQRRFSWEAIDAFKRSAAGPRRRRRAGR